MLRGNPKIDAHTAGMLPGLALPKLEGTGWRPNRDRPTSGLVITGGFGEGHGRTYLFEP